MEISETTIHVDTDSGTTTVASGLTWDRAYDLAHKVTMTRGDRRVFIQDATRTWVIR